MFLRPLAPLAFIAALAACSRASIDEAPAPLGDFVLGHNIVVTDNMQKVPISRDATGAEWEAAMKKAIDDRFGQKRHPGNRIYNMGISVDGFALAPPGIPVVAAPKSVLVITANIWDDGLRKKLNAEGKQFTVFEELSGASIVGTGITRSREKQMEVLSANAARKVEDWLLEHPEWFGMTPDEQAAQLRAIGRSLPASTKAAQERNAEAAAKTPGAN